MALVDAPDIARDRGAGASPVDGPRLWVLFLVLLGVAAVLRIPTFSNRVFNSDEAYLATQAQSLIHGARLYVDTVDRKPPVVPYLYAAVFRLTGSDDLGPVRVLAVLAQAVTALLIGVEARRRFRWHLAGLVAGLLYLLAASGFRPLDAQAASFEVFMLPMMTAAFLFGVRGRSTASGLMLALATLTKQTALVAVVPLAWLAWRARRWRGIAFLSGSFGLGIVVAAAVFGWQDFFRWVFTSNGSYLDANGVLGYALRLGYHQTVWFLFGSLALVLLLPFAWSRRREDLDLWLWLASGVLAVVAGLRFFGHYYLQLVPPLTLLGMRGLTSVPRFRRVPAAVLVAILAVGPAAYFLWPAFTGHDSKDTQIALAVGAYVAAHTSPDQRVLVWGQAPEVYWSSDRRPAVRFATTGFVTGTSGGRPLDHVGERYAVSGAWKDFLDDLQHHPPVLIADMSTANQRQASHYPPRHYPQFAHYLARGGWHRVATVDGVAILRPSESP
jgi:4-amino-4-deoxy-L-arabinose transferase-like glycosyltransferase